MSTAEHNLAATLVVSALSHDIGALTREGGATYHQRDFLEIKRATKGLFQSLQETGSIARDANGDWSVQNAKIAQLTSEQAADSLPHYQATVLAMHRGTDMLAAEGRDGFLAEFYDTHHQALATLAPQTVRHVAKSDREAVVGNTLNLLQAMHAEPGNAHFLSSLDRDAMDKAHDMLGEMHYLLPGENEARKEPLGNQAPRGSIAQQEAIFDLASQAVANIDSETVKMGDRPTAACAVLKSTIANAQMEEFQTSYLHEVEHGRPEAATGGLTDFDSIESQSAAVVHRGFAAAAAALNEAQLTDNPGTVRIPTDSLQAMEEAYRDYIDAGIDSALGHPLTRVGDIESSSLHMTNATFAMMETVASLDPHGFDQIGGDDGAAATESDNASLNTDPDNGDVEVASKGDGSKTVYVSEVAEPGKNEFGPSDRWSEVSKYNVDQLDANLRILQSSEVINKFRQYGNLPMTEEQTSIAGTGSYAASLEQVMGGAPENPGNVLHRAGTFSWYSELPPNQRGGRNTVFVQPGKGLFKDYRPGGPGNESRRLSQWVNHKLFTGDAKEVAQMSHLLTRASTDNVIATTSAEARHFIRLGEEFVVRDRQANPPKSRENMLDDKKPDEILTADFRRQDIARAVKLHEASGSDRPFAVDIHRDGNGGSSAVLSHPEGPRYARRLEGDADRIAALQAKTDTDRTATIHVPADTLKHAAQRGGDTTRLHFYGDNLGRAQAVGSDLDNEVQQAGGQTRQTPAGKRNRFQDAELS